MRFIRDVSGLSRISTKYAHKPNRRRGGNVSPKYEKVVSEDTRIRKDINAIIFQQVDAGKCDIEIEIYLTEKYPSYAEYIRKMIVNYITKVNLKKAKEQKNIESGDER